MSSPTTYYISPVGSDAYDGLEAAHTTGVTGPWRTIARVNAATLSSGDALSFLAGGVWNEQLIVSTDLIIEQTGEGTAPKIGSPLTNFKVPSI